jgi:hypothetical protein
MQVVVRGRAAYQPTYEAMRAFTAARDAATPDELWICEHPPVFTQGLAGKPQHVHDAGAIPVVASNRGGQVTYHGPGQVVAYPLIDLQRAGYFVKEYVYRLEEAVIRTLRHFGVTGHRVGGAPGIYREDCRAGHQGQPRLRVPRCRAQRRDGPATLLANRPLRLRKPANGRPFYNRHLHHLGRSGARAGRQTRRPPRALNTA